MGALPLPAATAAAAAEPGAGAGSVADGFAFMPSLDHLPFADEAGPFSPEIPQCLLMVYRCIRTRSLHLPPCRSGQFHLE